MFADIRIVYRPGSMFGKVLIRRSELMNPFELPRNAGGLKAKSAMPFSPDGEKDT